MLQKLGKLYMSSMIDKIPTYKVDIETVQMTAIALVDEPALESNFQVFSGVKQVFAVQDAEKRIVFGPVIRVDYPILRKFEDGSLYNVVFTKEVAQKMISDYLANNHANDINLGHTSYFPDGIEPIEFFIKDSVKGISPKGFEDIADGSVFASFHISDDGVWSAIKEGTFRGFSLECFMDVVLDRYRKTDWVDVILDALS